MRSMLGLCDKISSDEMKKEKSEDTTNETNLNNASKSGLRWFHLQFHDYKNSKVKQPHELVADMTFPSHIRDKTTNEDILRRIHGSLLGLAIGDALGAHVEFKPRHFLVKNPVTDLSGGGTWGLQQGQFTDDTSMALCLAASLIDCCGFVPYDQLVRYRWWHRYGYMSSTGRCFDIGAATSQALAEFERRQLEFSRARDISIKKMDYYNQIQELDKFNVYCSDKFAAGNGGLMRMTPVPLFFYRCPKEATENSGISANITHGDMRARDASRYYGALIVGALHGLTKTELLDENFYENHKDWFSGQPLVKEIDMIARGSYKQKPNGYDDGIRGKGFVVNSLEAALWAFCFDEDSFEKGVLAAVNLGDDTDTTAAIYGQLAGAYYGFNDLPSKWTEKIYAHEFIKHVSECIFYQGENWSKRRLENIDSKPPPHYIIEKKPKAKNPNFFSVSKAKVHVVGSTDNSEADKNIKFERNCLREE